MNFSFDIKENENCDTTKISLKSNNYVLSEISFECIHIHQRVGADFDTICNHISDDDTLYELSYLNSKIMRMGYARMLLEHTIELLTSKGADFIYLYCSPYGLDGFNLNKLKSFYESFGFFEIEDFGNGYNMLLKVDRNFYYEISTYNSSNCCIISNKELSNDEVLYKAFELNLLCADTFNKNDLEYITLIGRQQALEEYIN